MATVPENEVLAFYHFLGERMNRGASEMTVEESVEAFRAYQRDIASLRQHLAPSIEQAKRGESKPLDAEAVIGRVYSRLAKEGIGG
ncbi:MAG: hypothetical protein HQ581_02625 [Planctomycetes bacterium]|nr:hypothetical protein [Planctomycetota bacterium]